MIPQKKIRVFWFFSTEFRKINSEFFKAEFRKIPRFSDGPQTQQAQFNYLLKF